MAVEKRAGKALFITFVLVESFTLPIFRSGGRTGLTFWGWVWNHTVFGPPVEYVPEEDYVAELKGVERLHAAYERSADDRREAAAIQ